MELSKQDTQKAKGIAIMGMVMLHLFCRLGDLPYTPWIWLGEIPAVYYLGLFGDICVPIYCFCSGYAHYLLKEKDQDGYGRSTLQRIFRFLINYWIVVVLFSVIGLVSANGAVMPRDLPTFFGNIFLYDITYNGAWWFVVTYIILSVLSPMLIGLTNRLRPIVVCVLSGLVYFAAYLFRFQFTISLPNAVADWLWQQLILLGTSQFGYMLGMVCRKERWVTKLRACISSTNNLGGMSVKKGWTLKQAVCILPVLAFLGHCIVQPLIVAPITAASVLVWLFAVKLPGWLDCGLLLMGRHSTNIWLIHMFFYLTLFENFVFLAKYPLFVLALMLGVCFLISMVINAIYHPILTWMNRKKQKTEV